jgi:nitrogen regulatory protein PII
MKQVDEMIMTFNLDRIKEQLRALGVNDIVLSEARSSRPTVSTADFLPWIHVRAVVPDHLVGRVAEILRRGA